MAKKISRKELKQDEFVEAAADFGHWLENNWQRALGGAAVAAVLVLGAVAWTFYARHNRTLAEQRLSTALVTFDEQSWDGFTDRAALDGLMSELAELADSGGGSIEGVARLYRGSAHFQTEAFDEAESELKQVVATTEPSSTLFVTAQALLANVYQAAGRTDEAVETLSQLLDGPMSRVSPEQTLLRIGEIYEEAGRVDEARETWQRIVDEYATSRWANQARQLLNS